ncbi:MAG: HD domain-containing protein [Candidatus Omnitrophica bacterium]|nr:HD domain-containing protein [Candidatus Omnitrophota bacterium]
MARLADVIRQVLKLPDPSPAEPALQMPGRSTTPAVAVSAEPLRVPRQAVHVAWNDVFDQAVSEELYARGCGLMTETAAHLAQRAPVDGDELARYAQSVLTRLRARDPALLRLCTAEATANSLPAQLVHVGVLSIEVGRYLGFDEASLIALGVGALLHDLGMVQVEHLARRAGPLSSAERLHLQSHPVWGAELARQIRNVSETSRLIIAQEHERFDGGGYPRRLRGSAIHPCAELVGLIDHYEALTHDRPHRPHVSAPEAFQQMLAMAHAGFRRELLGQAMRCLTLFPVGTLVELSNGTIARVIATHPDEPFRPTVAALYDPQEGRTLAWHPMDLSAERSVAITRVVEERELVA